jgi:hypothetical protein
MDRIYLDTSVFGGYFEVEFEVWTKILFDRIKKGHYTLLLSQLIDIELTNAPENVKELALSIPSKQIEFLGMTIEATQLADTYIREKVVGETSRADCLHIALATLNNADILVSWNFKHIVNVNRIRGYNSVNYRYGHKILEIRTPREILEI